MQHSAEHGAEKVQAVCLEEEIAATADVEHTMEAASAVLQPRCTMSFSIPRRQSLIAIQRSGSFQSGANIDNSMHFDECGKCDTEDLTKSVKKDSHANVNYSSMADTSAVNAKSFSSFQSDSKKGDGLKEPLVSQQKQSHLDSKNDHDDRNRNDHHGHSHSHPHWAHTSNAVSSDSTFQTSSEDTHRHSYGHSHGHSHDKHVACEAAERHNHGGHSHMIHLNSDGNLSQSLASAMILFLALSFHGIMEGVALGAITASDEKTLLTIFIAIVSHKGLESFSLGTSLMRSHVEQRSYWMFLVAFSAMTTIGIGIGMLMSR
jgi:hypothetical protein